MFKIPEKSGFDTVERLVRFSAIATEEIPALADLNAGLVAKLQEMRAANQAWTVAVDRRVAKTRAIAYRDDVLDRAVAAFSRRMLDELGNDREHPRYLAVFPRTVSEAMGLVATDAQSRYVRAALTAVQSDVAAEALQPRASAVRAALAELDRVCAERDALMVAEQLARNLQVAAVKEARLTYNELYPKLQLLFPGERAYIRSFFYEADNRGEPE